MEEVITSYSIESLSDSRSCSSPITYIRDCEDSGYSDSGSEFSECETAERGQHNEIILLLEEENEAANAQICKERQKVSTLEAQILKERKQQNDLILLLRRENEAANAQILKVRSSELGPQLEAKEREIEDLSTEIRASKVRNSELEAKIEVLKHENSELTVEMRSLEQSNKASSLMIIEAKNENIDHLKLEIKDKERIINELEEAIKNETIANAAADEVIRARKHQKEALQVLCIRYDNNYHKIFNEPNYKQLKHRSKQKEEYLENILKTLSREARNRVINRKIEKEETRTLESTSYEEMIRKMKRSKS